MVKIDEEKIVGERHGRMTIIESVGKDEHFNLKVKCRCDCGTIKIVRYEYLKHGRTKSCGCYRHELATRPTIRKDNLRLYKIWDGIKHRCYCKNSASYKNYGGRGITMCDEWKNDFIAFYQWAVDNGYDKNAPSREYSIDRIDVNGNYEPNNCRWADKYTQSRNRRDNVKITNSKGETHVLIEWAEIKGINPRTLFTRYSRGLRGDKLLYSGDIRKTRKEGEKPWT